MIDLGVIAAAGPIVLGAAIGLAARRGLRVLDARRRTPTPATARADARTAR